MTNLAEPIGEAWMTGNDCRFANGPFAGRKLGEVWPEMTEEWVGTEIERSGDFPLLVKFIFPQDKLSVQVHPDDAYAAVHEQAAGGRGKTEMWYAVDARPGAEVLVGLKPSVTREIFARAIADGTAENCLEHVSLRAGDAVFVPSGTAHTIGSGLVLCEVQQNSDLTYRVYDYNRRDANGRSRELHIEKAMEVMRFGKQCGGKITPASMRSEAATRTCYAVCRYFVTEHWAFEQATEFIPSPERFEILIILDGAGKIRYGCDVAEYRVAQVWFIPAALDKFAIAPASSTAVLRTYVPGDLDALQGSFADRGMAEGQWRNIVHL